MSIAPTIAIVPLSTISERDVEALLDRAFEPGRHARTAYRVRGDQAVPIAALSFVAVEDGTLLGSIQCWPVTMVSDDGKRSAMVMVGPVAVEPARQRSGVGRLLVTEALRAAAANGLDDAMMLIGDPEYYGRFFGFSATATAAWRLPGPVDRHRLLARGNAVPTGPGLLGPSLSPVG